jgi:hypothetical protein
MKTPVVFFLASFALAAQTPTPILGPYSATSNFSIDLAGAVDAAAWGSAGSIQIPIRFNAPAGYHTRILRIYGDFVAWAKTGVIAPGTSAEVGWGLKTTAPDGSARVTYPTAPGSSAYDNSFAWIQNVVTSQNSSPRATFDFVVSAGGLLGADGLMICQPFVALNTSGLTIHMEPTFTIVYQFEVTQ